MMDKRLIAAIIVCVLALLALPVLAATPDYTAIRTSLYENHVRPGYAQFANKADALAYETRRHCKNSSDNPDKRALHTAFHNAMDAWQTVQHIRHGPIAKDDRHARLQFWPDKRGITERHLRKLVAEPASAALGNDIAGASIALQGFPALEQLLFADAPLSQNAIAGETSIRCRVAEVISDNIAAIADALNSETKSTATGDARTDVANSLNDVVTGLEFVQSLKLILPARTKKPRPHLLENWRSNRSLRNVGINIRALREYYILLYGDAAQDNGAHRLILDQFDAAAGSVRAMGENGKSLLGVDGGPEKFLTLAKDLERVLKQIATTLPGKLQVNLGFNSLDGD